MKRIAIWTCAVVLVLATGVAIARASVGGWQGHYGHRWGHLGPMGYVVHELNLSNAQQQQIHSLWHAERPAVSGLIQEFAAENKEMDQATANGNFDEGRVQEVAARQGTTVSKLLVEKEHFTTKVYTSVLSPEQRTKADKLQSRWHERLGHIGRGMEWR
jgi:Spy/CpxP family protein refolding chaperone